MAIQPLRTRTRIGSGVKPPDCSAVSSAGSNWRSLAAAAPLDTSSVQPASSSGPGRTAARKAAAERAMDAVRDRFGKAALETGLVFADPRRRR